MKRIVFVVLIVFCVSLLCAYRFDVLDKIIDNVQTLQPAATISPPSDVYVGMLMEDFYEVYPDRDDDPASTKCSWGFENYIFIFDENNNPVIVTIRSDGPGRPKEHYCVTSVVAYDKNDFVVSENTFRSIEKGMKLHDVVALVGNPYGNPDAGGENLGWYCGSGLRFFIKFVPDSEDRNVLIVANVYRVDEIADTVESIFD